MAIDGGDEKKALCQELGADTFVDFTKTTVMGTIMRAVSQILLTREHQDLARDAIKITGGGAHGVIVMSSSSKAYEQAPFYVRKAGVLCCIGLSKRPSLLWVTLSDLCSPSSYQDKISCRARILCGKGSPPDGYVFGDPAGCRGGFGLPC